MHQHDDQFTRSQVLFSAISKIVIWLMHGKLVASYITSRYINRHVAHCIAKAQWTPHCTPSARDCSSLLYAVPGKRVASSYFNHQQHGGGVLKLTAQQNTAKYSENFIILWQDPSCYNPTTSVLATMAQIVTAREHTVRSTTIQCSYRQS